MTKRPKSPLPQADYDAIEAAVMETARGRWFLAEYANRHRSADTAAILEAINRLEARLLVRAETDHPAVAASLANIQAPLVTEKPDPPAPPARAIKRPVQDIDWLGSEPFGTSDVEKLEEALEAAWPADDEPVPIEDDVLFFVDPPEATPDKAPPPRAAAGMSSEPRAAIATRPAFESAVALAPAPAPGPKSAEPATYGDWGLRLDDPTLTMTRAQKLALFS